jgi:hypothetical protein
MTLYATLTFDLDKGVTSSQRDKFYAELTKAGFTRHKLTTLWTGSFSPLTQKQQAKTATRQIVDQAAAAAIIRTYEALVAISDEPPIEWSKPSTLLTDLMRFG